MADERPPELLELFASFGRIRRRLRDEEPLTKGEREELAEMLEAFEAFFFSLGSNLHVTMFEIDGGNGDEA